MQVNQEEKLTVSVGTAARLLGISRNLAYELVRQNRLPALRLGRRLLIPKKMLDDLLAGDWQPPKGILSLDPCSLQSGSNQRLPKPEST